MWPFYAHTEELIALRQLSHPADWASWARTLDALRALPETLNRHDS